MIGLFVSSSKINFVENETISLSNNKFSSPESINFNKITKSVSTPFPSDNNFFSIL